MEMDKIIVINVIVLVHNVKDLILINVLNVLMLALHLKYKVKINKQVYVLEMHHALSVYIASKVIVNHVQHIVQNVNHKIYVKHVSKDLK